MAGRIRKFRVHGAYRKKSDARRKEKSAACGGLCFIRPIKQTTTLGKRVVRRIKRFLVLEKL